jgi:hypothetical protein
VPESERQRPVRECTPTTRRRSIPAISPVGRLADCSSRPQLIRNHAIWTGRAGTLVSTT